MTSRKVFGVAAEQRHAAKSGPDSPRWRWASDEAVDTQTGEKIAMASGYVYRCDDCGYSVRTSGPHEFYRDKKGRRKPYGHPTPASREAEQRGIYGFSAEMYCPHCDQVYDVIMFERDEPGLSPLSAWRDAAIG